MAHLPMDVHRKDMVPNHKTVIIAHFFVMTIPYPIGTSNAGVQDRGQHMVSSLNRDSPSGWHVPCQPCNPHVSCPSHHCELVLARFLPVLRCTMIDAVVHHRPGALRCGAQPIAPQHFYCIAMTAVQLSRRTISVCVAPHRSASSRPRDLVHRILTHAAAAKALFYPGR